MEYGDTGCMRHIGKNDQCAVNKAPGRNRSRKCVLHRSVGAARAYAALLVPDGLLSGGFCWASPELRSNVTQMACIAVARRRYPDWLDREDGIRPQVGGLTQQASSHKVCE